MPGSSPRGDLGQAAVESALVMPLMVVVCLGLVQLTMMQQAKILTEYAAFNAARAGIVWNGNNERMRDAAFVSLLPTMGRTDGLQTLSSTYERQRALDEAFRGLDWGDAPEDVNGAPLRGLVRIDTLSPGEWSALGAPWKLRGALGWEELDFDGPDGFPESPELDAHLAKFFDVTVQDDDEKAYRRATVLSIRVRYWYELRVPLANWFVFLSWYAANSGVVLTGAVDRPSLEEGANVTNTETDVTALRDQARGISHGKGHPTALPAEMARLWDLAHGGAGTLEGPDRRYFVPLTATYSMRMQSNFHRKWIMHP